MAMGLLPALVGAVFGLAKSWSAHTATLVVQLKWRIQRCIAATARSKMERKIPVALIMSGLVRAVTRDSIRTPLPKSIRRSTTAAAGCILFASLSLRN